MEPGDFAELTGEHNDCEGLCRIVAIEGCRVTVQTESGKVVTVHERGLNLVPGPEELRQRAEAIKAENLRKLESQNPKPVAGKSRLKEFAWDKRKSCFGRIA